MGLFAVFGQFISYGLDFLVKVKAELLVVTLHIARLGVADAWDEFQYVA